MDDLVGYLTVFVAAATPWLEVLLVVPAGIVAGLPAGPTAIVGAIGNISTLVPAVLAGDRIRAWWRRRRGDEPTAETPDERAGRGRSDRATRLFERYGIVGLALAGPLLTGIHVAALVGLAAGADRRRTLVWCSAGVVVWSALAAVATVLGLEALVDTDALPDLFDTA